LKHAEELFKVTITEEKAAAAEEAGAALQAKGVELETAEGAAEFNTKVMNDMQALRTSSEVTKMMEWVQANSNPSDWDDATKEAVAEYQAKSDDCEVKGEELYNATQQPIVTGSEPARTWKITIDDDKWAALNTAAEGLKDFEMNTMKDLPLVKNFRQHALNVRFSHEFKALEKDFKTVTQDEGFKEYVTLLEAYEAKLVDAVGLSDEDKAMVEESFMVKEVMMWVDMENEALKTGNLNPILNYMIHGKTDGDLSPTVSGATVQRSAGVNNASGNGASRAIAAVGSAMLAFAATQF